MEVEEDLTFETFVANNIKRLVLSNLFDDQLHHISVLGACITRIKLNVVVETNLENLFPNIAAFQVRFNFYLLDSIALQKCFARTYMYIKQCSITNH